jgi:hypothetical protein
LLQRKNGAFSLENAPFSFGCQTDSGAVGQWGRSLRAPRTLAPGKKIPAISRANDTQFNVSERSANQAV